MATNDRGPDYRFSLANERTYLAWIRTSLALVAGGLAAAKALDFDHELARWVVAGPPIVAGTVLAVLSIGRWQTYEAAMAAGEPLPVGRHMRWVGLLLAVYAIVALAASALD